ncbi:hypothetical protein SEVIR_6G200866v4 [Setaria viridis]
MRFSPPFRALFFFPLLSFSSLVFAAVPSVNIRSVLRWCSTCSTVYRLFESEEMRRRRRKN